MVARGSDPDDDAMGRPRTARGPPQPTSANNMITMTDNRIDDMARFNSLASCSIWRTTKTIGSDHSSGCTHEAIHVKVLSDEQRAR